MPKAALTSFREPKWPNSIPFGPKHWQVYCLRQNHIICSILKSTSWQQSPIDYHLSYMSHVARTSHTPACSTSTCCWTAFTWSPGQRWIQRIDWIALEREWYSRQWPRPLKQLHNHTFPLRGFSHIRSGYSFFPLCWPPSP